MKVQKTLGQEEMTLVNNISSLINELKSASGQQVQDAEMNREGQPVIEKPEQISEKAGEPSPSDKEIGKAGDPSPSDPSAPSKKKVEKEIVNTESDVSTARDDPEDRMLDALSEVDVSNVDEVKKAVALVKKIQMLRAEKSRDITPLANAMVQLTQVVKSIVAEQRETQTALSNILDGIGVTKQMELVTRSAPSGTPIVDANNKELASFLGKLMQVAKSETPVEEKGSVQGFGHLDNTQKALKNIEGSIYGLCGMVPPAVRSK